MRLELIIEMVAYFFLFTSIAIGIVLVATGSVFQTGKIEKEHMKQPSELKWKTHDSSNFVSRNAFVPIGHYSVFTGPRGNLVWTFVGYSQGPDDQSIAHDCSDVEDGMAQAQADWETRSSGSVTLQIPIIALDQAQKELDRTNWILLDDTEDGYMDPNECVSMLVGSVLSMRHALSQILKQTSTL